MSDTPHSTGPAPAAGRDLLSSLTRATTERWRQWSAASSPREKVHAALLLVITVGLIVHHCVLFWWYVEDTAISFAYARHLAHGEGLVPFPGGERIEGYSNPTWVALLAGIQLLGIDPFFAVRWIQLALVLSTAGLVYATLREATGRDSDVPLVGVAFLAASSQFAIYGGAGLENALLNFLIALGILMTMRETAPGERAVTPWSALVWLLVALSRPEGILYAAVAGFCAMVFQLQARRSVLVTLQWLVLFFAPWSLYQLARWWYFAWPFPNTYYAKLEDREPTKFVWDKKGWMWSRRFFHETGEGYFLPVWLLGAMGDGRWRYVVAIVLFFVLGSSIELSDDQRWLLPVVVATVWAAFWLGLKASEERPPRWLAAGATVVALLLVVAAEYARSKFAMVPSAVPAPTWARGLPSYELGALVLLLPLLGLGARGWRLRTLSFLLCSAVIFFAIYVQWDWMKGFRWYATATVPGALLFAFGVDGLVRYVEEMFAAAEVQPERWRAWSPLGIGVAALLVALQLPGNIAVTSATASKLDASPEDVKQRVDYVDSLRDRLHVLEPWVDLDVDQGAHLWWSEFVMMDIAGLIDVPLAHHRFARDFVREYVFQERRPHYAHVHGAWASNSRIPTHPEWRQQYVEVPGYGKGNSHPGNFVRRDLIVAGAWPHGEAGKVALQGGVVLYGPHVPSEPAAGRKVYLELGIAATNAQKTAQDDFRVLLFAADAERVLASWDLPPGYGWLPPREWKVDEVFVGKFDLPLPDALPPGSYDLGVVVLGGDGRPLGPEHPEEIADSDTVRLGGTEALPARFAAGELVYPAALTVLTVEDRARAAADDRNAALRAAEAGDCEGAEQSWWQATWHRAGEQDWRDEHLAAVSPALAACWARTADGTDQSAQIAHLVRAHRWDRWSPEYRARAAPLADALYREGLGARRGQDWARAYRLFSDAVAVVPTHAWARRYAEEARGIRLGIDPETKERKKREQEERAAERKARIEAGRAEQPDEPDEEEAQQAPEAGPDAVEEAP